MDNKLEKEKIIGELSKTIKKKKSKGKKVKSNNHLIKKRSPFQSPKEKNHVYVNNKSNFKAHLKLCEKILDTDAEEVVIHGLGKAINRACSLAQHLKEIHHDTLDLDIKTSSVTLTDDLEPTNDDEDYQVNKRVNSAIHIRVFKIASIGSLRFEAQTKKSS